jgi:hypothetical protein
MSTTKGQPHGWPILSDSGSTMMGMADDTNPATTNPAPSPAPSMEEPPSDHSWLETEFNRDSPQPPVTPPHPREKQHMTDSDAQSPAPAEQKSVTGPCGRSHLSSADGSKQTSCTAAEHLSMRATQRGLRETD